MKWHKKALGLGIFKMVENWYCSRVNYKIFSLSYVPQPPALGC